MRLLFTSALLTMLCLVNGSLGRAGEAFYSDDTADVESWANTPKAIGDLGDVQKIVDLRGFLPLSMRSKKKSAFQKTSFFNNFTDIFQYYKYDIRRLDWLYYGLDSKKTFDRVQVVHEKDLNAEELKWAEVAYGLTEGETGKKFYGALVGSTGFENAEPIAVLLTEKDAFVVVNFRWSSMDRKSTGQTLMAFEISRKVQQIKSTYCLYENSLFSKEKRQGFADSVPYVSSAIKLAGF